MWKFKIKKECEVNRDRDYIIVESRGSNNAALDKPKIMHKSHTSAVAWHKSSRGWVALHLPFPLLFLDWNWKPMCCTFLYFTLFHHPLLHFTMLFHHLKCAFFDLRSISERIRVFFLFALKDMTIMLGGLLHSRVYSNIA